MEWYSAPGKVILYGEHFVVYGNRAVLCAINRRVQVSAVPRSDDIISIQSDVASTRYSMNDYATIDPALAPLRHIAESRCPGGVDIHVRSEIPPGAGLGSSSACCVAAAAAVSPKQSPPRSVLALALDAERTIHPNSSGADCAASTYGGIIEYSKESPKPVWRRPPDTMRLVVADSGAEHSTARMVETVARFARDNPERFDTMKDMADSLAGLALSSMDAGDIHTLGRLASQNQSLLEDIGVSNDTMRDMIHIADRHSYGSKITGAGGGGCIVAITDGSNSGRTASALESAGYHAFEVSADAAGVNPL